MTIMPFCFFLLSSLFSFSRGCMGLFFSSLLTPLFSIYSDTDGATLR